MRRRCLSTYLGTVTALTLATVQYETNTDCVALSLLDLSYKEIQDNIYSSYVFIPLRPYSLYNALI